MTARTKTWQELYEQRLDWAFEAKREFREEVDSDEIRHFIDRAEEAERSVVVAAGRTHVGKTSLILRLLGVIDPESRQRVENVLRGGRKEGESATPTATILAIAPDDQFRIQLPSEANPSGLSDEAAKHKVKRIRKQVVSGEASETEAVRVELPQDTVEDDSPRLDLDFVDLPGWGSFDSDEQVHVRKLVRNYLRRAHLVLIVEEAEKIQHLQHQTLVGANPNWMHLEERFGIVLTRSASVMKDWKDFPDPEERPESLDEYVEMYRDEIRETTRKKRTADALSGLPLYPVEFAESWEELNKAVREHTEEWIDTRLEDLLDRVNRADAPVAALHQLVGRYQAAGKIREQVREERDEVVEDIEAEMEEHEKIIDAQKDRIEELREKKERWAELKRSLPSVDEVIPESVGSAEEYSESGRNWYKVWDSKLPGKLKDHLEKVEKQIRKRKKEVVSRLQSLSRKREFDEQLGLEEAIDKVVEEEILSIKRDLEGRGAIIRRSKWKEEVNRRIKKAKYQERRRQNEQVSDYLDSLQRWCESREEEVWSKLNQEEEALDQRREAWRRAKEKREELEEEYEDKIDRIDQDLEKWRRLEERFQESYRREMERVRKQIESSDDEYHRIALMAFMGEMRRSFEALVNS